MVDEERLQEHCKAVGNHLLARLRKLQDKYDVIGDVRGHGLMLGVEMVSDRGTKEPAKVCISIGYCAVTLQSDIVCTSYN